MSELQGQLVEIHRRVLQLKFSIESRPFFELGADPINLQNILNKAFEIDRQISNLSVFYEGMQFKEQNFYFAVLKASHHFKDFLISIRREQKGSREKTSQALDFVNEIEDLLNKLADNASFLLFPYERHIEIIQTSLLNQIDANHPGWKRFTHLTEKLRAAYQKKELHGLQDPEFQEFDEFLISFGLPKFHNLPSLDGVDYDAGQYIPPMEGPTPVENYWALIIGVGEYENSVYGSIPNAANDANQLADLLMQSKRYDSKRMYLYSTQSPENGNGLSSAYKGEPKHLQILTTLKRLKEKIGEKDLFLFYFSGHGILAGNNVAFMIAQDSNPELLEDTSLMVLRLSNEIQALKSKVKVIILDMCHAGAIISTKSIDPMQPEFFQRMYEGAEGTAVMTSCKAGEYSFPYDGADKPISVFTHYLLKGLEKDGNREGIVTANELHFYTYNAVQEWAEECAKPQTPQYQFSGHGSPIIMEW